MNQPTELSMMLRERERERERERDIEREIRRHRSESTTTYVCVYIYYMYMCAYIYIYIYMYMYTRVDLSLYIYIYISLSLCANSPTSRPVGEGWLRALSFLKPRRAASEVLSQLSLCRLDGDGLPLREQQLASCSRAHETHVHIMPCSITSPGLMTGCLVQCDLPC